MKLQNTGQKETEMCEVNPILMSLSVAAKIETKKSSLTLFDYSEPFPSVLKEEQQI